LLDQTAADMIRALLVYLDGSGAGALRAASHFFSEQ
jgi:hypothetical protein